MVHRRAADLVRRARVLSRRLENLKTRRAAGRSKILCVELFLRKGGLTKAVEKLGTAVLKIPDVVDGGPDLATEAGVEDLKTLICEEARGRRGEVCSQL